jgi:hypothetical protein
MEFSYDISAGSNRGARRDAYFQTERWWDRKADAYSRIIEALYHLVAYTSMIYKRWTEDANFSEDYKREMEESSGRAFKELRVATGIGRLRNFRGGCEDSK